MILRLILRFEGERDRIAPMARSPRSRRRRAGLGGSRRAAGAAPSATARTSILARHAARKLYPAVVQYASTPYSVELREMPAPEIGPDDVLLRVGAVSVCGSDIHQWEATHSWPVNVPVVL